MSGERPVPLWPEGLRKDLKLPPVENQRTTALTEGVSPQVAKQPSQAEQKERERLSKPPPSETPGQDQAEPQRSKRKRTVPYRRRDPEMVALVRGIWAAATGLIYEGLSEEQIRLSEQAVAERFRMVKAGATREQIRKMKDEYLLKKYPGLSLEEAREKSMEHSRMVNDSVPDWIR